MNKIIKKISALLVTAVIMGAMIVPAVAAAAYTPVDGTSTSFKKYLVMDANATVPNVTFSYTIAAGTPIAATDTTVAVLAGPTSGSYPKIDAVSFATGDETYDSVQAGDREGVISAGQKYARKEVTVSFVGDNGGVTFDEPGIYRYTITEVNTAYPGLVYDATPNRTLDVYVTDNGQGALVVNSYVLHTGSNAPAKDAADYGSTGNTAGKSDGYVNSLNSYNLTIGKAVSGNQASRDKYFKITVELYGLTAGNKYTVSLGNDDNNNTADGNADAAISANSATKSDYNAKNNVTELTVDADGRIKAEFYLQHYQYIVIRGLPKDSSYTITEDAEDYKSVENATIGDRFFNNSSNGTMDSDKYVGFTNTKSGSIPTGVLVKVAPVAVVGIVVIAGIVFLAVRNFKIRVSEASDEEDEGKS